MEDNMSCPVCELEPPDLEIIDDTIDYHEQIIYNCARCGKFLISKTASAEVGRQDNNVRAKLSAWIRMQTEFGKPMPEIIRCDGSLQKITDALQSYTPDQKQSILLSALISGSEYPGNRVLLVPRFDYPLAWAINEDELIFHLKTLLKKDFLEIADDEALSKETLTTLVIITPEGWEYYNKTILPATEEKEQTQKGPIDEQENGAVVEKIYEYDVFISHASEDKKEIAEPLAQALENKGKKVWLDKFVLKIGGRLMSEIDNGLINSRYGIVIISPDFFKKDWTINELEGLVQKEAGGRKVILPVWHNMSSQEVFEHSPILAGRIAGNTKDGIEHLADELILAMTD